MKFYTLISCLIALSSTKCGLVPNQVYLKRGERKQLIFWTDQNYDATSTKPDAGGPGEQVDLLLQLVNGAMPKPEQLFNTSEEEENYPQFQGVPSTTTTTTTTRTTTIVTETTTMIVEGTTSMSVAEVDTVISNEDSTVTQHPSETSTGALEEGSGDIPAAGDNVDETVANNDNNDVDVSMDGVSSTTETLIQTDSPAIPFTTLETMLEDDSTNTISPVIVLDNAEEIVEIVEPVIPSQEMDGPTPSIIMAETINPEELIMNNELDEVTTTQGSMEDSTLSDSVTEIAAGEGLQVDSHNKEIPTTVATPLEILSATANPLLSGGTQNAIEQIDDVNDTNNDDIAEMRTTISNVDGFHITVSHPIKQEPGTESPLDAIENEESNPVHVLMPQPLSDDIDTGNSNTSLQSSEGNAEKVPSSDEMTTISILENSSEEKSTFFEEEESTKVESTSNKGEINNSSTINANEDDEIMDDDSEDYSSSLDSFQVSTKQNSSFNIEEDTKDTNGTDMSSTNNDDEDDMIQSVTSTNDGSRVQDQTLTVTTKAPSEMATEKDNNMSSMNNNNTEDRTESVPAQTNGVCQFISSIFSLVSLILICYHFMPLR